MAHDSFIHSSIHSFSHLFIHSVIYSLISIYLLNYYDDVALATPVTTIKPFRAIMMMLLMTMIALLISNLLI